METKEQIEQFLILQKKSEQELKAICEGLSLTTEGKKQDLVDRLLKLNAPQQTSVVVAQAIPLRSRDDRSQPLEAAITAMKNWRKLIFNAKNNTKEFQLLNNKGKSYTLSMKYITCSPRALQHILSHRWYLPLRKHRDLIAMLEKNPDKFEANIIQKPDPNGNSWLMLHVNPKAA